MNFPIYSDRQISLTKDNFDLAISMNYYGGLQGIQENLDEYFDLIVRTLYFEKSIDSKTPSNFSLNEFKLVISISIIFI
jgi:hypothetical protein